MYVTLVTVLSVKTTNARTSSLCGYHAWLLTYSSDLQTKQGIYIHSVAALLAVQPANAG
jgi:hypothetical protein